MKTIVLFLAGLTLWAQAPAGPKSAFDKPTLEAYVRHLQLYPAQVKIEVFDPKPSEVPGFLEVVTRASMGTASEEKSFLISKDGQKILQATVYDVKHNPFKKAIDGLKTSFQPSMGTPGAPVVIVLFSDFQCAYCQKEADTIRKELLKAFSTQVRVYFKDFPISQIHPWAMDAALTGRCVFKQNALAFWDYHDWVFGRQNEITPENFQQKFADFAKTKNLDAVQVAACTKLPNTRRDIDNSMAEARSLGASSTPTLFINGRMIPGYVPWENLKAIIELEAGYQATAKNAGEHCCSVQSPSLLQPQPNPVLPAIQRK